MKAVFDGKMNKIEKAISVLEMENELMQFDPNTGEDYPIELQNQDNQDLYNANLVAISALEEKLSGGWIPVSERLPNEEECNKFDVTHPNARKFLCTIKVANYEPQVRTIYLSEIVGWKYSAQDYNEYVIAWRPLPSVYKEVENE